MAEDPILSKRLQRARDRQDEFLARRIEAGDESAKRARVDRSDFDLEPGPGGASESSPPVPDAEIDGAPMTPDSARSRAASTVTYRSDTTAVVGDAVPEDDGMELPMPDVEGASAPASSSAKRRHEGPEGDDERAERTEGARNGGTESDVFCMSEYLCNSVNTAKKR